ncbi:MAG: cytosine permease [Bilifractor sp.]|jgi:NCS1 nucleoside transporter family
MSTRNLNQQETTVDIDYAEQSVPVGQRQSFLTMFMIMLGFTFFSASMWVGQEMAKGLDFYGFLGSLFLGGAILAVYTGLLGYVGARTGMSLDLMSRRAFGLKGSYLPSAMISFTQIGWFGVGVAMFAIPVANELLGGSRLAEWILVLVAGACMTSSAYFGIKSLTIVSYIAVPLVAILGTVAMILAVQRGDGTLISQFAKSSGTLTVIGGAGMVIGSFVSGGTATPNFSRFARNARQGVITTVVAFFIGNSLMFFFGAVSSIYVGGNDIFEVMINLNLFYLAVLVLGLNIWTTNDNALYSAGLGLANIFGQKKKPMVLISGVIGTVTAVWLYWNFTHWLNILNCTLPPIGIILILDYFLHKKNYTDDFRDFSTVNWFSVIGVIAGALGANIITAGIPSITGMLVAAIIYLIGYFTSGKSRTQ